MSSIRNKVAHVKFAMRSHSADHRHTCHWPGCGKIVPPAVWGCKLHWYRLPLALRRRVWAAYRIDQETNKAPSAEYLAVAREVQLWILENYPNSGEVS